MQLSWAKEHLEMPAIRNQSVDLFFKQTEGSGKIKYMRQLVPMEDSERARGHSRPWCPLCFCRDFSPARPPLLLHDWRERGQRVQSCLQWANLICSSSGQAAAGYKAVVGQLCAWFFPGFTVGNWSVSCREKVFLLGLCWMSLLGVPY